MTCGDKLWSFHTPFRHPKMIESDGTHRQIMVILRLLSSRGGEPDDMRRQIMVIPHLFAIWRRSSLMARKDKLWPFYAFCHPEAASPMTRGDKLWSFRTFCQLEASEPVDTQRQIMVILHFWSSRDSGFDDMRINHMVSHLFSLSRDNQV